jgi:flagellin-specific chaperone FliS
LTKPWFNEENNTLILDEYLLEMDSYKAIIQDSIVTEEELKSQVDKVIGIMKNLESKLDEEQKELTTNLLCELSVLHAISQKHINPKGF